MHARRETFQAIFATRPLHQQRPLCQRTVGCRTKEPLHHPLESKVVAARPNQRQAEKREDR